MFFRPLPSIHPLLIDHLIEIRRMGGLIKQFGAGCGLRSILVRHSRDFLTGAGDVPIVSS